MHGDAFEVYSAGTAPHGIDARAVKVMVESGVDISSHTPTCIADCIDIHFDLVITVCDSAIESCPVFPGSGKTIHCSFDDPPLLASKADSEEEALTYYRRVRDEIRDFVVYILNPDKDLGL